MIQNNDFKLLQQNNPQRQKMIQNNLQIKIIALLNDMMIILFYIAIILISQRVFTIWQPCVSNLAYVKVSNQATS